MLTLLSIDKGAWLFAALVILFIVYRVYKGLTGPLSHVHGPALARFTRLWEFVRLSQGQFAQLNQSLHKKYGTIVRLAPNRFSISDPDVVRTIYGVGSKFTKSDFYVPFGGPFAHRRDVFSQMDNAQHAADRRNQSNMYSMSSLVMYEPFVDKMNGEFTERLAGIAKSGQSFDLLSWMQYYAFDVIGEITFGRSFGLVEAGNDKDGLLHAIHFSILTYSSMMGLLPEFHPWYTAVANFFHLNKNVDARQTVIKREMEQRIKNGLLPDREDFLAKCLKLVESGKFDQIDLNNVIYGNISAGSDTTGTALSSIVYNLIQTPECLEKLRDEITAASEEGRLSNPVTFQESQQLPYLAAVIKEGLRIQPVVGMIIPRVVPKGGAELAGTFFPEGSVVGVNPWVIHMNEKIFGAEPEKFRPERWMTDKAQASLMEQHFMAFGQGARTCIGKNISMLEMNKMLPMLLQNFDFSIAPDSHLTTNTGFIVKPKVQVNIQERQFSE